MLRRQLQLIKELEEVSAPAEAGRSDMRPELATATAACSRGCPAAKVCKLAATSTIDDEHQDTTKLKRVVRASRRRGKLHQMLDMSLEIMMEINCFDLVLCSICLTLVYVDMRSSSTQRYSLCIQAVESIPRVLHPSKCPISMEVRSAERSWPTTMPSGSQ